MNEEQTVPEVFVDIRKMYIDDLSVEVPHAPQIFQEEQQRPEVGMNLVHEVQKLPEANYYAVKLRLTVTAKDGERTIYLVQVSQGGVFEIQGLTEAQLHHALNAYCPSLLFPYAREVVSNAVVRAGFPALYLMPVNFDALYQERMQEQVAEQEAQQQS